MATLTARITLANNGTYRGIFVDAAAAEAVTAHNAGDLLQVHTLKRYYIYDPASLAAPSASVIAPNDVLPLTNPGRWVCSTVLISGIPYTDIPLDSSMSTLGDGGSILVYDWVLVDDPTGGVFPAVILVPSSATATLRIPVDTGWTPGGIFVFLRVTNDVGQISSSDPFDPRTLELPKFTLINATVDYGLLAPAAGVRNWQRQYRDTMVALDGGLTALAAVIPTNLYHTSLDKNMYPASPVTGDQAAVSGVTITDTPAADGYVRVYINGAAVTVGDNDTTNFTCYFSNDGGLTAKVIGNITASDQLYWNSSVAGYDLDEDTLVEFDYEVAI